MAALSLVRPALASFRVPTRDGSPMPSHGMSQSFSERYFKLAGGGLNHNAGGCLCVLSWVRPSQKYVFLRPRWIRRSTSASPEICTRPLFTCSRRADPHSTPWHAVRAQLLSRFVCNTELAIENKGVEGILFPEQQKLLCPIRKKKTQDMRRRRGLEVSEHSSGHRTRNRSQMRNLSMAQ